MDKLLRGYGRTFYQKQGNEAEGNAGKLIFFLPRQGMWIWWKAEEIRTFQQWLNTCKYEPFRYSSTSLQPFLAIVIKVLLSFPAWWRTTYADFKCSSSAPTSKFGSHKWDFSGFGLELIKKDKSVCFPCQFVKQKEGEEGNMCIRSIKDVHYFTKNKNE